MSYTRLPLSIRTYTERARAPPTVAANSSRACKRPSTAVPRPVVRRVADPHSAKLANKRSTPDRDTLNYYAGASLCAEQLFRALSPPPVGCVSCSSGCCSAVAAQPAREGRPSPLLEASRSAGGARAARASPLSSASPLFRAGLVAAGCGCCSGDDAIAAAARGRRRSRGRFRFRPEIGAPELSRKGSRCSRGAGSRRRPSERTVLGRRRGTKQRMGS